MIGWIIRSGRSAWPDPDTEFNAVGFQLGSTRAPYVTEKELDITWEIKEVAADAKA